MKIINIITGLGAGGAESNLYKLVVNDKKNIHIIISLTDLGIYGKKYDDNNIMIYSINFNNYRLILNSIKKIFKIVNDFKPDIIHSWMYYSNFLSILIYPILVSCIQIFLIISEDFFESKV